MADNDGLLPRVLLAAPCTFLPETGGGSTFSALFANWPADRLASLHLDLRNGPPEVCANYLRLSAEEFSWRPPFSLLQTFRSSHQETASPSPTVAPASNAASSPTAMRRVARRLIGSAGLPQRARLTQRLRAWIADFRPDLLYTILGDLPFMELVDAIRQEFDLPMVAHAMDDGIIHPRLTGLFAPLVQRQTEQMVKRLLGEAHTCMSICPMMGASYGQEFGKPFPNFQNTIDTEHWITFCKQRSERRSPQIRLLYRGSIFTYAQLQSLADCVACVAELAAEGELDITLDIYTPLGRLESGQELLQRPPAVHLHDARDDRDTYFASLAAADILILPINFDQRSINFIRYSMPTKVPEYLVAQTPILVYGPPGTAVVDYALREQWGHVVMTRDKALLRQAIVELATQESLRTTFVQQATLTAARNHEGRVVRREFEQLLCEAAR